MQLGRLLGVRTYTSKLKTEDLEIRFRMDLGDQIRLSSIDCGCYQEFEVCSKGLGRDILYTVHFLIVHKLGRLYNPMHYEKEVQYARSHNE